MDHKNTVFPVHAKRWSYIKPQVQLDAKVISACDTSLAQKGVPVFHFQKTTCWTMNEHSLQSIDT